MYTYHNYLLHLEQSLKLTTLKEYIFYRHPHLPSSYPNNNQFARPKVYRLKLVGLEKLLSVYFRHPNFSLQEQRQSIEHLTGTDAITSASSAND